MTREINPFEKLTTFDWEELNGKTLKIIAAKHEGAMVVVGKDTDSDDIYVLYEELSGGDPQ